MLERAPEEESGGNSRFTAGLMRVVYNGVEDLKQVIELSADEIARSDFGTYTEEQFFDDMARVTEFRCDPDLTEILVKVPSHGRLDARERCGLPRHGDGRRSTSAVFKFWGGLTVEAVGGGPGLVDSLTRMARKKGVEILYRARAVSLVADDAGVHGVGKA